MIPTPSHTTGPFFPGGFIRDVDADLSIGGDGQPLPGRRIVITGTIVDVLGDPVVNGILELAQLGPDGNPGARGRGFKGWGRAWTDRGGRYRFVSLEPGVAPGSPRAPHLRFMLIGSGLMRPLVTEAFFPEHPATATDPQLALLTDTAARNRVMLARQGRTDEYRFDLVLRGPDETPFLAD